MNRLFLGAVALIGCVQSATVICEDGRTCPAGTACQTLTTILGTERQLCVTNDARAACADKVEGDACELPGTTGGACHGGACIFAECGNGLIDPGEACDDENLANNDDCSEDCRSTLTCRNGVLDQSTGEDCDPGDAVGHDGCASTCQLEQATWVTLLGEPPSARELAALAYDASRRRIVLFGGATRIGPQFFPLDDTWEWDGNRWRVTSTSVAPTNRYAHTMAYDAAREQLVVFSGVNNQSDTWVTVGGMWQQLATAHAPPTRDYASMAYDAGRKQIVLFGGYSPQTQDNFADTWTWDGSDWHDVTSATRPAARFGAAMAYDPRRDVVVLFGGYDTDYSAQVWELAGTTWTNRTPTIAGPSPRAFAAMAYDPGTGEVLVAGGRDGTDTFDDVYSWNGTRWLPRAPLPSTTNDMFVGHSMATDPIRGRVVVLGTNGTLYEWSDPEWTLPPGGRAAGVVPAPRDGAALVRDPLRDEIVMFGGETDATQRLDETWVWRGSWSRMLPATTPPPRRGAAIAYDEVRREVVMYGGCGLGDGFADTWVWRGGDPVGTWVQKLASSAPGKRCDAAMAFDAKRGNIVLVAGHDGIGAGTFATTTWTWDGATWTLAAGATTPPARGAPVVAYDRVRERVVLFGGGHPTTAVDYADTWSWDGTTWTDVSPPTSPAGRTRAGLAWDPARARLVLAGGLSTEGNYAFADAYEWDGSEWKPVASDYPPRQGHGMTTAPEGAGVLMFGGNAKSPPAPAPIRLADTLRLRWDGDVFYEACTDRDGDGDGIVGCLDPDCWWMCTPTCSPKTTCAANGPRCGDQSCNALLETCFTCPADCGACPVRCGDFVCSPGEACPGDCAP